MIKMEWYPISKASKELNVSRQSIYNKLKDTKIVELKNNVKETEKGKMINTKGLEVLRKIFNDYLEQKANAKVESKTTVNDNKVELLIETLQKENEYLKEQLTKQIQMTENSQILLKNEQEKSKLLLETTHSKSKWWKPWSK